MVVFPNAKINLGLQVLRKREDGFHDLSTVFYPLPVCDALEVLPGDPDADQHAFITHTLQSGNQVYFSSSGIPVDGPVETNLIVKAVELFDKKFGIESNLKIHLHKVIPMGAGLGGGSSDAAFMLKVLNDFSGNKAGDSEMLEMAALLGSDCSFFLVNRPVIAGGRGELLHPVTLSLKGYSFVVVKPPVHVSTRSAFESVIPAEARTDIADIIYEPVATWQGRLTNDFETGVFQSHPRLLEIKNQLTGSGAIYASMTGSGSALFGIYSGEVPHPDLFKNCSYFSGTLE